MGLAAVGCGEQAQQENGQPRAEDDTAHLDEDGARQGVDDGASCDEQRGGYYGQTSEQDDSGGDDTVHSETPFGCLTYVLECMSMGKKNYSARMPRMNRS